MMVVTVVAVGVGMGTDVVMAVFGGSRNDSGDRDGSDKDDRHHV